MNYIKLMNAFWQLRRRRPDFDPYVISLYFALVSKANKEEWRSFEIYREDITALAGMSPSAYYKARKILKECGAIDYQEGASKLTQCTFSILQLYAGNTEGDTEERQKPTQKKDSRQYGRQTEGDTEDDTILDKPLNLETSKPLKESNTASLPPLIPEETKPGELFPDLTAETKKRKEKGSAQKEKKTAGHLHLFQDSPFIDLPKFLEQFTDPFYNDVHLEFYYHAVKDWSAANGTKKVDWIAVARGFMRRDHQESKLRKISNSTSQQNGQPTNSFGQKQQSGSTPSGAELAYIIASQQR